MQNRINETIEAGHDRGELAMLRGVQKA